MKNPFGFLSRGEKATPSATRGSSRERFWEWFQANDALLKQACAKPDTIVPLIGRKLDEVHPDLMFETGQANDGVYEIIISAGGLKAVIPEVTELVKAAPSLQG